MGPGSVRIGSPWGLCPLKLQATQPILGSQKSQSFPLVGDIRVNYRGLGLSDTAETRSHGLREDARGKFVTIGSHS